MLTPQEAFRTLGLDVSTEKHTVKRAHREFSRRYLPNIATPPAAVPRYRRAQCAYTTLEKIDFPSVDFSKDSVKHGQHLSRDMAQAFINAGIGAQVVYVPRLHSTDLADPYDYDAVDSGYLANMDSGSSDSRSSSISPCMFSSPSSSSTGWGSDTSYSGPPLGSSDSSDSDSTDFDPSDDGAGPVVSAGPRKSSSPQFITAWLLWFLVCIMLTSLSYLVFSEVQPAGWLCKYALMLQDRLIANFHDMSTRSLMSKGSMPDLRSRAVRTLVSTTDAPCI